jgi:hypothetical protein
VAPFSGALQAPGSFAGLDPPIGGGGITFSRTAPLRVSWEPEGFEAEQVWLEIDQIQNGQLMAIDCQTSDADAMVQVDTILLATLAAGTASAHLARTVTTYAEAPNATIALVGNVWVNGPVTVQ